MTISIPWTIKRSVYQFVLDCKLESALAWVLCLYWKHFKNRRVVIHFDNGFWVTSFENGVIVDTWPKLSQTPETCGDKARVTWFDQYQPRSGDCIVDLGAGSGTDLPYFCSAVGVSGRVVAYEAHPRVYDALTRTAQYNNLCNATLRCCAVSDDIGELLIEDDENHVGNAVTREASASTISVPSVTLDSDLQIGQYRVINFIKINIEGAELSALRGMSETLRRTKNVCVSCHDFKADRTGNEFFRTMSEVRALLECSGFKVMQRRDKHQPWLEHQLHGVRQPRVLCEENPTHREPR